MTRRTIRETQRQVLLTLAERKVWRDQPNRWVWETRAGTLRIMRSLERRGLVGEFRPAHWRLTRIGRQKVAQIKRQDDQIARARRCPYCGFVHARKSWVCPGAY